MNVPSQSSSKSDSDSSSDDNETNSDVESDVNPLISYDGDIPTLKYPWLQEGETSPDQSLLDSLPRDTIFLLETNFNHQDLAKSPRLTTNRYGQLSHSFLVCDRCLTSVHQNWRGTNDHYYRIHFD